MAYNDRYGALSDCFLFKKKKGCLPILTVL